MKRVFIKFEHSPEDCVQLTAVIKCLTKYKPHWTVDVAAPLEGFSAFHNIANATFMLGTEPSLSLYDHKYNLSWKNTNVSKAVECLQSVFGIEPDLIDVKYQIIVGPHAKSLADNYIKHINKDVVFAHEIPEQVTNWIEQAGYHCINLTQLDGHPIWEGRPSLDVEILAALISKAKLVVSTNSLVLKTAIAVDIPTISLWHGPVHSIDYAPHNLNIVPHNCVKNLIDKYEIYSENPSRVLIHQIGKFLGKEVPSSEIIIEEVRKLLKLLTPEEINLISQNLMSNTYKKKIIKTVSKNPMSDTSPLRTRIYDFDYYEEHRRAGLDYLGHGDWQINYGKWFVESLSLKGKSVLDIGCACGSIACGIAKAGSFVSGCDVNEHMITKGRLKWLNDTLKICDATNLHYWSDNTFDAIHSNNVFEHFKPELVPFILKEIYRVTKPNGILFAVLDTEELYERQNRKMENEDPTHVCVRSMSWWEEQLVGWVKAPDLEEKLKAHPGSYHKKYDWPCLVYRKQ